MEQYVYFHDAPAAHAAFAEAQKISLHGTQTLEKAECIESCKGRGRLPECRQLNDGTEHKAHAPAAFASACCRGAKPRCPLAAVWGSCGHQISAFAPLLQLQRAWSLQLGPYL